MILIILSSRNKIVKYKRKTDWKKLSNWQFLRSGAIKIPKWCVSRTHRGALLRMCKPRHVRQYLRVLHSQWLTAWHSYGPWQWCLVWSVILQVPRRELPVETPEGAALLQRGKGRTVVCLCVAQRAKARIAWLSCPGKWWALPFRKSLVSGNSVWSPHTAPGSSGATLASPPRRGPASSGVPTFTLAHGLYSPLRVQISQLLH